jgi:hypothetical protein
MEAAIACITGRAIGAGQIQDDSPAMFERLPEARDLLAFSVSEECFLAGTF